MKENRESPRSRNETVRLEFLGCMLTAYTSTRVWLDVIYFAKFLRGPDGTCAFCHGDPVAESPCTECGGGYVMRVTADPDMRPRKVTYRHIPHAPECTTVTWIDREFMAAPDYSPFEMCPCCDGRPA